MKRYFVLLLVLFIAINNITAQNLNRESIDSIFGKEKIIDPNFKKSFSVKRNLSSKKKIAESWEYVKQKGLLYFFIEYTVDSTKYSETYYLYNNKLIFSSENEISYFPSDGPGSYSEWGGKYYFSKGKMIDYETLGHGKSESEDDSWNPEKETLKRYEVRRKQLKNHKGL